MTDRYSLLPADLREPGQLAAALQAAGLDPAAPTYVLSECVLVYMQPQHRWAGCWFGAALIASLNAVHCIWAEGTAGACSSLRNSGRLFVQRHACLFPTQVC